MTLRDELAAFATGADLPAAVVDDVQLRLMDAFGVALAAHDEPLVAQVASALDGWYADGGCGVIGHPELRGAAPAAASLNAVLVGVLDFEDTHTETLIHPSCCIVPAALALAEEHGLSGSELIRIAAIGHELMIRLGLAATPGAQMQVRGFQTTALAGAAAAAVMAALATGAPVGHALSISTSFASGLIEAPRDGTLAKALQPGWAVQAGFFAARAAAAGITGPSEAFEGTFGLFPSHLGTEAADLERVTAGLGSVWESLDSDFKLYPVCHHLQGHVEAALSLRAEAGGELAWVKGELCAEQVPVVCEPVARRVRPQSAYAARFCFHYTVALALTAGVVDPASIEAGLSDPAVLGLAERVDFRARGGTEFPKRMPGRLEVGTADGRVLEREFASAPGRRGRAVRGEELREKFLSNAGPQLGDAGAAELLRHIEALPDAADVTGLLRAPAGQRA